MPFDSKLFIEDILKDITIDDAQKQALLAVASNPVVAKRFEDNQMRQSDYSAKSAELQTKIKTAQDYWNGLSEWEKAEKIRIAALEKKFGASDGDVDLSKPNTNTVSKEELQQLAQEAVSYNNTLMTLGLKHYKEFGDILNTDKLLEVAGRDKVNIAIAYDRLVQPQRDTVQQKELEKRIAQAREEGKQEAIKNFQMPNGQDQPIFNSGITHALDTLQKKSEGEAKYGAMAAVRAFGEAKRSGVPVSD